MSRALIFLAGLLLLSSSLVNAQDSPWSVGAHLNSIVSSDVAGTNVEWGLLARYRALSFLSIEGRLNVNSDNQAFEFDDSLELSALIYPYRTGIVDVYARVGAGYVSSSIENDVLIRLGAGVDVPISSNFSFFTDFHFLTLGDNEIYTDQLRIDTADEVRTSIGFNYRF